MHCNLQEHYVTFGAIITRFIITDMYSLSSLSKQFHFFTKKLLLAATVIVLTVACNKTPEHAKHIPKQASGVLTLNTKTLLMEVLSFKDLMKASGSDTVDINPSETGIDLLSNIYAFNTGDPNTAPWSFVFGISNKEEFKTFIQKQAKDLSITDEGGLYIGATAEMGVAFNGEMAVVSYKETWGEAQHKLHVTNVMNLTSENSLLSNDEKFEKLQKENVAISAWLSFDNLKTSVPVSGGAEMLKGSIATLTIDFKDGETEIDGKYFNNNPSYLKNAGLLSQSIDDNYINEFPMQNGFGAAALKIQVDTLKKALETYGMLGNIEGGLGFAGIAAEDVFKMLSGDILLSVAAAPVANTMPSVVVGLGIKDEAALKKILGILSSQSMIKDNKTYYGEGYLGNQYSLILKKNMLVVVNSPEIRTQIIENKLEKSEQNLNDAKNQTAYGFVDFDALVKTAPVLIDSALIIQKELIKGGSFSFNMSNPAEASFKMSIFTKPADENSLTAILKNAPKISKHVNQMEARRRAQEMLTDSLSSSMEAEDFSSIADTVAMDVAVE